MLTGLIVAWVVVTTVAVVLAYYRMTLGLHDVLDIHLASKGGEGLDVDDIRRGGRMAKLDKWGIPLTVLSALTMIAIVLVWAMENAANRY
jgi:hypothetical protein